MGKPTANDPLGQRLDPSDLGDMLNAAVDQRIAHAWRGRAVADLSGFPDGALVLELVARGWVVYRPSRFPEGPPSP
jgi:hypothetical protein